MAHRPPTPEQRANPISRRTLRTPPRAREAFLATLSTGSSVTAACRSAGIGRTAVYAWRSSDEVFAAAWDEAVESGTDRLEDEAFRRAHDGVSEPVVSSGKVVVDDAGVPLAIRRYSDGLMTTLLKGRRPERYKDRLAADLRADVRVGSNPDADFAVMVALLDGLASRKAAGLPTPELDALAE